MMIRRLLFSTAIAFMYLSFNMPACAQQLRWQWAMQSNSSHDNRIGGMACDTLQNIYLTGCFVDTIRFGAFKLTSEGGEDIYMLKLDQKGNVVWTKSAGGQSNDYPTAMTVSPEGMIYTAGFHGKNAAFDNNLQAGEKTYNLFVSMHTTDGKLKWIKSFGSKRSDYIASIAVDSLGRIYFGGYFRSQLIFDDQHIINTNNKSDAFVTCLDSLGEVLWVQQWGGFGNDRISAIHIQDSLLWLAGYCTADMNIETATISPSDNEDNAIFTLCCSLTGDVKQVFSHVSGREAKASCIIGLNDGKSIIAGNFSESLSFGNNTVFEAYGDNDMFIAAFDSTGNLLWQRQMGSNRYDNLFNMIHHPWGYIIVTGLYAAPLIFDQDTVGLSNPYCDSFAASYNYEGVLQEVNILGGTAEEFPQALAYDKEGHVYIAGLFQDSIALHHSVLRSTGTEEIFLAKLYHCNKNKVTFSCDTVFFEGTELALKTEGQYVSYEWEQGLSKEPEYIVTCSKIYQLRVEDSLHCVYRDSITVKQSPVAPKIQIRAELLPDKTLDTTHPNYYSMLRKPEDEKESQSNIYNSK